MDDFKYSDIVDKERPASKRPKMSLHDRAAQFAPFAALTGHEELIEKTGHQWSDDHQEYLDP